MKEFKMPSIHNDNQYVNEGLKDYYEEEHELDVERGVPFENTYASLQKIFILLTKEDEKIQHNFESDFECFDYLNSEFQKIIIEKIIEGDFEGVVRLGQDLLLEFADMKEIEKLDNKDSGDSILITEAVNYSAKTITGAFYMVKPALIIASAKNGAKIGVEDDDGWDLYTLFDEKVGTSSYHDPNGEVRQLIKQLPENIEIKQWSLGWSGLRRQDMAFQLISEKERLFLQRMRYRTLPGENAKQKRDLIDFINEQYSI